MGVWGVGVCCGRQMEWPGFKIGILEWSLSNPIPLTRVQAAADCDSLSVTPTRPRKSSPGCGHAFHWQQLLTRCLYFSGCLSAVCMPAVLHMLLCMLFCFVELSGGVSQCISYRRIACTCYYLVWLLVGLVASA